MEGKRQLVKPSSIHVAVRVSLKCLQTNFQASSQTQQLLGLVKPDLKILTSLQKEILVVYSSLWRLIYSMKDPWDRHLKQGTMILPLVTQASCMPAQGMLMTTS